MLQALSTILGLISLGCYFYIIYLMFNHAETTMGIVCLVGLCALGLGGIVAFIYGWIKAREWEIVPFMAAWSGCIVLNIAFAVAQVVTQRGN